MMRFSSFWGVIRELVCSTPCKECMNDMGNGGSGVPDLHAREASMTMLCQVISSHGALGQGN